MIDAVDGSAHQSGSAKPRPLGPLSREFREQPRGRIGYPGMGKNIEDGSLERLEDRIRERAYRIWEEEGRPEGRAEIHWQKARALIEGERARAAQKHSAKAEDGATDGKAANTPDAAPAERTPKEESDASVDRQIEDSFPASDAPSYTAGKHLGTPDRSRPQRVKKRR